MIRRVLAEMEHGTATVKELSRKLGIEPGVLEGMLGYMVRKGLVRAVYPQCRTKGCRGCRYSGRCEERPVIGYERVAKMSRDQGRGAGN